LNFVERLLVTGFYTGYSVFASGTCGSAVALVIYVILPPLSPSAWVALLLILFLIAVYLSQKGEREWGHDPSQVVIDEVVGFFVTTAFLPQSLLLGIVAFFLFRVLDIAKPPPARQAEHLPGGWGVVVDDVVAAIYANLLLRAGLHFIDGYDPV
jgi:phosphatidylglycerophosphatase A